LKSRRAAIAGEPQFVRRTETKVVESHEVVLEVATPDKTEVLRNLLGLYMHDLSDSFPIKVGADGRFIYGNLSLYWSDPETRFPFLIHSGAELAGFALATRGSPATDDPEHLDVAEFFVLRGYRRKGVGRQAAFLLWNRLPGQWVVRVSVANRAGLPFWSAAVEEYTRGEFTEIRRSGSLDGWRVFTFASANLSV
jgi:predicted acetyltransferase